MGEHWEKHLYTLQRSSASGAPFYTTQGWARVQAATLSEVASLLHLPQSDDLKIRLRLFNLLSALLLPPWKRTDKHPEKVGDED